MAMAIEILEVWGVRFHHHLSGFSSLNSNESHQGWKSAFLSTVENPQKKLRPAPFAVRFCLSISIFPVNGAIFDARLTGNTFGVNRDRRRPHDRRKEQ
jgi:hypothetical protein|tara:strand:+ start:911 stop:1204 length:294 start_codon:yes stop_codon:yes gene_type:complete